MRPIISIGNQDFSSIREHHCFYIDKTTFIKEWWESEDIVTLITRPRRFGKTLNMSMIENFFSNQYSSRSYLFEDLSIWQEEKYKKLQGSYPVIFLSFADIKANSFASAKDNMVQLIIDLYAEFDFLRQSDILNSKEKEYLNYIKETMSDSIVQRSLRRLSFCLNRHYGKKVIILLDEYDTPLQEAYINGYWDEMVAFIRNLFNSTFKTNPYLERGLMTGITRVSKESIFSDLNNLEVVTTTSKKYTTSFGFTEAEVKDALKLFELSPMMKEVKFWYDGFQFGEQKDIYNPWSITKYLDSKELGTYWANTSSNSLAEKLIREGSSEIKIAMEDLLAEKPLITTLDEEIVFNQLYKKKGAIWSLLLASGYLKVAEVYFREKIGKTIYHLKITNQETLFMFQAIIEEWFSTEESSYNDFIKALLLDDIESMNEFMNDIALQSFSSFDSGKKPSKKEPERFYHGFVLGLIVELADKYCITSNRESGFGRYDIVLEPLQVHLDAIIIEFKVHRSRTEKNLQDTVNVALAQIKELKYDTELIAKGISKDRIRHYGFAFKGKEVLIGSN